MSVENILSILIYIPEIVRILIRHKKKLEIKKEIWNLIKDDVEKSNRLLNEILMDLSKIFGAAFFLPRREYSNMLDRSINEINVKVAKLGEYIERILANLKLHKDSVKEVLGEKDWLAIEPLINSLTPEGKINFEILFKTKYIDSLARQSLTIYGNQYVLKNFEELSTKISRIFANTSFENLYINLTSTLEKEKAKKINKCLIKFVECIKKIQS